MKIKLKDFYRRKELKYYRKLNNPYLDLTLKLDITKLVKYCNIHKNLNASIGFVIAKAVNKIDNFKYRLEKNKLYFYDKILTSYTYLDNNKVLYFDCDDKDNYQDYINEYNLKKNEVLQKHCSTSQKRSDLIWYSSLPWFSFTSLTPPLDDNSIPQFIWGKVVEIDNGYYINLMIHVHHGFVDGYHIKLLIDEIEKVINDNFK